MTPEERQLVRDLFDRLSHLEREQRDPDAERLIREGLARAPNAMYALVQTVLLQDEGLRAADEHIAQLQDDLARAQAGGGQQRQGGSFLGDRRDSERPDSGGRNKWNTGEVIRGSVPPVRPDEPMGAPPGYGGDRGYGGERGYGGDRGYSGGPYRDAPMQGGPRDQGGRGGPWQSNQGAPMGGGYGGPAGGGPMGSQPMGGGQMGGGPMGGQPMAGGGRGGSFLGTAAAVAAGAVGGGLLMGGIRSAMGGHGDSKGPLGGALDRLGGGSSGGASPQRGSPDALSREAGLDDIGHHRAAAAEPEESSETDDDTNAGYDDLEHDDTHDSYDDDNQ